MIEITEKSKCCGCSACAEICPKHCIEMEADEEGFLYPIVNKGLCVKCRLCEKVCPVHNCQPEQVKPQNAYLVQHKDDAVRIDSTSGGAFTAIAQSVLSSDGVVFGVALNEKLRAVHAYVEKESELALFRNSKYMQSDVGLAFSDAERFLREGRMVLFSGTSCQIEGLYRFLKKDYDNLLTVDVVCRAVPSPMIFGKYLEYCEKQWNEPIVSIRFRDKYYGYKYSTLTMQLPGGRLNYHNGVESDPWLRAFFSNMIDRPSCHECVFKKRYRMSDMTIWDCFSVSIFDKELDDDKGTTRVLVHSEKGKEMIQQLHTYCKVVAVSPEKLTEGVKELVEKTPANIKRAAFFADAKQLDGVALFEKWFPLNTKVKLKHMARVMLNKTGLYANVKTIVWKIKGKN